MLSNKLLNKIDQHVKYVLRAHAGAMTRKRATAPCLTRSVVIVVAEVGYSCPQPSIDPCITLPHIINFAATITTPRRYKLSLCCQPIIQRPSFGNIQTLSPPFYHHPGQVRDFFLKLDLLRFDSGLPNGIVHAH